MNRTVHRITGAVAGAVLAYALYIIGNIPTWQVAACAILAALIAIGVFVWLFSHQPKRRR